VTTGKVPITDVAAVAGIGLICFPLLLLLLPNLEASRTEVRISQAYMEVRRIHQSVVHEPQVPMEALPVRDPWGQPYRHVALDGDHLRVVSSGPNMSSPPTGTDDDDVYSDMPASPTLAITARKNRQWLIALAVTAVCWAFLAWLYMRYHR